MFGRTLRRPRRGGAIRAADAVRENRLVESLSRLRVGRGLGQKSAGPIPLIASTEPESFPAVLGSSLGGGAYEWTAIELQRDGTSIVYTRSGDSTDPARDPNGVTARTGIVWLIRLSGTLWIYGGGNGGAFGRIAKTTTAITAGTTTGAGSGNGQFITVNSTTRAYTLSDSTPLYNTNAAFGSGLIVQCKPVLAEDGTVMWFIDVVPCGT